MFGEGRGVSLQKFSLIVVFMRYVLLIIMVLHYSCSYSKISVLSASIETCPLSNG